MGLSKGIHPALKSRLSMWQMLCDNLQAVYADLVFVMLILWLCWFDLIQRHRQNLKYLLKVIYLLINTLRSVSDKTRIVNCEDPISGLQSSCWNFFGQRWRLRSKQLQWLYKLFTGQMLRSQINCHKVQLVKAKGNLHHPVTITL